LFIAETATMDGIRTPPITFKATACCFHAKKAHANNRTAASATKASVFLVIDVNVHSTPNSLAQRRTKGENTNGILWFVDDRPLTKVEVEELRRNLARLSNSGVENAYREAYKQCELKG
jgi:hypothetical protein